MRQQSVPVNGNENKANEKRKLGSKNANFNSTKCHVTKQILIWLALLWHFHTLCIPCWICNAAQLTQGCHSPDAKVWARKLPPTKRCESCNETTLGLATTEPLVQAAELVRLAWAGKLPQLASPS